MSFRVCKILFKLVQVYACYCKMFRREEEEYEEILFCITDKHNKHSQ